MSEQVTEETIKEALNRVCNTGPYSLEKSVGPLHVYRCQACGAELGINITVTWPAWTHYKPGCEPYGREDTIQ